MSKIVGFFVAFIMIATFSFNAVAQDLSPADLAKVEQAFENGNKLMEQRKHAEALTQYKQGLALVPRNAALLFNGGMAAFGSNDFNTALDLWKQMKAVEPSDWQVRTKLIQTYQALGKTAERDAERTELFAMWKKGEPKELKDRTHYCREQFEVNGKKVLAFEHFELTGNRALRYVFTILDATEEAEDWRISLGSYDITNNIWRETRNPKPKEGERLFHLDGYYKNGGHATFGMYFPEPTYDETRAFVVKILEGKDKPMSSTMPAAPKPAATPKP